MAAAETSTKARLVHLTFPFALKFSIPSLPGTAGLSDERDAPVIPVAVAWTPNAKNFTSRGVACCVVAESRGSNLQILTDKPTARIARRER
jgi:hypothetical protein